MKFRKKTYARGYMYIMRQNMKRWLLTYKHSAYVKQISVRRCWIARIIYDYFYLIEDAYALVEIIYIYIYARQIHARERGNFTYNWLDS